MGAESVFIGTGYRNGFFRDYGGSWLLTQLVGVAKAKELFFTGRRVQLYECLALGLFNQVVPDDQPQKAFHGTCETKFSCLLPSHRNWLHEGKHKQSPRTGLARCASSEADRLMRCAETNDHKEAVRKRLWKNEPRYSTANNPVVRSLPYKSMSFLLSIGKGDLGYPFVHIVEFSLNARVIVACISYMQVM